MFGLEQNQKEPFAYDIEKQLRTDAKKSKELLKRLADHEQEITTLLKKESKDSNLKILLEGYKAIPKVIKRIQKTK